MKSSDEGSTWCIIQYMTYDQICMFMFFCLSASFFGQKKHANRKSTANQENIFISLTAANAHNTTKYILFAARFFFWLCCEHLQHVRCQTEEVVFSICSALSSLGHRSDGCFWNTASWSFETYTNLLFWARIKLLKSRDFSKRLRYVITVEACLYFNDSVLGGGGVSVNHASSLRSPPAVKHWTSVYGFYLISDQFHQFVDNFTKTFV